MRLPLSTSIKTRTGAPEGKDARLKNAYIETRGEQSVVRKRLIAQGGVSVGTGTAQGGIGFNIGGTDYFIGFWGDTLTAYTGGGTTWNSGTSYVIGDHVSIGFVDYWANADNTNSQPPNSNWSDSYVPAVPAPVVYATWNPADKGVDVVLSNGNLTATTNSVGVRSTISKASGKVYFEYHIDAIGSPLILDSFGVGIATSSANIDWIPGIDSSGWGYLTRYEPAAAAYKLNSNTRVAYGSIISAGDIIGIALDADSGIIEFYLNGVSQGVAYNNLPVAAFFAMIGSDWTGTGSLIVTANFGASAFTYSVPSGYSPGLYT